MNLLKLRKKHETHLQSEVEKRKKIFPKTRNYFNQDENN